LSRIKTKVLIMKRKVTLGVALALAAVGPGTAAASFFVLDTGSTPSGGTSAVLSSANWYAAEFTLSAGQTITELSAYLTQGAGEPGNTFTWDLYSASGAFINATNATRESPTDFATGTYELPGWTTTNVDWSPGAGTYWIAMQVSGSTQTPGLDLPTESATNDGTVPALAFASATGSTTSHKYVLETSTPVGLEVTAVPLPAAVWLLGSGLLGLVAMGRRRLSH
jgi:hypothetical protein